MRATAAQQFSSADSQQIIAKAFVGEPCSFRDTISVWWCSITAWFGACDLAVIRGLWGETWLLQEIFRRLKFSMFGAKIFRLDMPYRDTSALAAEDNVLANEAQAPAPRVREQQLELHDEDQHVDVKRAQQVRAFATLALSLFHVSLVNSNCDIKPGMTSQFTPSA